jgi:group II intron reverse transcriptase/maturase
MKSAKSYDISKWLVWAAYERVKANHGAAGIDEQSIAQFEQNLQDNLYKVWNRMSSGTYFPPPVRQVEIPKATGGKRKLGIPTVADRVAQTVVKLHIEPNLDRQFHPDSFGYRPGKSAKQAIAITRKRCWQFDWVVEFDIKSAFDNIDHGLLMKAVKRHVKDDWALLYIERWLKAPFETVEGIRESRDRGTPQGGVVSPLLMNLFMHYVFDVWMQRTFPACPFVRYADDAVVHCHSESQAQRVMSAIKIRLDECLLMMHPEKSKIVYCKDSNRTLACPTIQFTFLGFTFRPRSAKSKQGKLFTSFQPAASNEAIKRMRQRTRSWNIQRQTTVRIEDLSRAYNAILLGWWNYYGAFYKTAMRKVFDHFDKKLRRWARQKYKRLARHKRRSADWLDRMKTACPLLFVHWHAFGNQAG